MNSDVYSSALIKLVYECLDQVSEGNNPRRMLCCDCHETNGLMPEIILCAKQKLASVRDITVKLL